MATDDAIAPFTVRVEQSAVDDLHDRLTRTRWPDEQPAADWSYGLPLSYARELAAYWRDEYDWRTHESAINAFPQFITTIDGAQVHFLHVRSSRDDATPLLLTHGWPGSFIEFLELIGPLTAPPDDRPAFHVVVPTIPGFGFSGHTSDPGWGPTRVAQAWAALMQRLGYERYLAHGGDWGATITHQLMRVAPDAVIGAHLTMLSSGAPPPDMDLSTLTHDERSKVHESLQRFGTIRREEMGYGFIQSTKPQTLAYGLADSPVGQLCWIIEKFHRWTDNNGLPEDAVDRDVLLTNVSIYWFTNTAGSSARIYYERAHSGGWGSKPEPSTVPTAVVVFPRDLSIPIRRVAEQYDNIVRWTDADSGGHFGALERPELLADDIREFSASIPSR
ncbi:epoxide hydrolase family protein [Antrihabitans cavernicola]|uniref:Epoxide hydrolase n=1 Tax=Antrihabitans cavernicola TaxID=2495913 RepID=A0A5A7S8Z7_9NOCA|nr:epoxide hydrolase family protein [Spelaeibacter cavernicola]KAA0021622.1 epoxide hydrolase [Spelaeibacter cavernicola]